MKSADAFASTQCSRFRSMDSRLELFMTDEGRRMRYNRRFPSRCCTIHCKMTSTGFYGPVVEVEGRTEEEEEEEGRRRISPYFPDGTLCNTDEKGRYVLIPLFHKRNRPNEVCF